MENELLPLHRNEIFEFGHKDLFYISFQPVGLYKYGTNNAVTELTANVQIYTDGRCLTENMDKKTKEIRTSVCTLPELYSEWFKEWLRDSDTDIMDKIEKFKIKHLGPIDIHEELNEIEYDNEEDMMKHYDLKYEFLSKTKLCCDPFGNIVPDIRFLRICKSILIDWQSYDSNLSYIKFVSNGYHVVDLSYFKCVIQQFIKTMDLFIATYNLNSSFISEYDDFRYYEVELRFDYTRYSFGKTLKLYDRYTSLLKLLNVDYRFEYFDEYSIGLYIRTKYNIRNFGDYFRWFISKRFYKKFRMAVFVYEEQPYKLIRWKGISVDELFRERTE
jgi:hypothetical protein